MTFFVVTKNCKTTHEVKRYVKDDAGVETVWCDTWSGRHVIGKDCFWCKADTVMERIWNNTKSIPGFKMMAENSGCSMEEIIFFINLKKKRVG